MIYPYDKVCIVCEKPIALSVDSNHRLHAEGKPAVQFADGVSIYAYHGVILPEWYGRLHPHQWQSKWVLKEQNAEVWRALIQEITYDRICQELAVTELDSWQEYTLLSIEFDDDFDNEGNTKPVYLLKMTKNFKGGTRHAIDPWNQSQIANRKSSSPRIYPWGRL
ncbi:DUF6745 domain-containing protein [Microcoleus sp. AT3-D2]|uniref:DUF6745 domain-containing protein n=1 Tax=Microcoleus sp. AT3-D2 TaxID=2818612 RepID=UPI002FD07CE9